MCVCYVLSDKPVATHKTSHKDAIVTGPAQRIAIEIAVVSHMDHVNEDVN